MNKGIVIELKWFPDYGNAPEYEGPVQNKTNCYFYPWIR